MYGYVFFLLFNCYIQYLFSFTVKPNLSFWALNGFRCPHWVWFASLNQNFKGHLKILTFVISGKNLSKFRL